MGKIDRFLFGLGMPHAGLEELVGTVKRGNSISFGNRVHIDYDDGPYLCVMGAESENPGEIKNTLVFLSSYARANGFDEAVTATRELLADGIFRNSRVSVDRMIINGSVIMYRRLSPYSLGRAIEIARRRKVLVGGPAYDLEVYYYAGRNDDGVDVYIDRSGVAMGYYGGFCLPSEYRVAEETFNINGVDGRATFKIFRTESMPYYVIGPHVHAMFDNALPVYDVIMEAAMDLNNWTLRGAFVSGMTFDRNAGPFKVVKEIGDDYIEYKVVAVNGRVVYSTRSRRGESLNFSKIKRILL